MFWKYKKPKFLLLKLKKKERKKEIDMLKKSDESCKLSIF